MNAQDQKKYMFHVAGMHCKSCVIMIEGELRDMAHVTRATSNLEKCSLEVEGNFGIKEPDQIADELTKVLLKHGYTISVDRQEVVKKWSDFKIAIPLALLFAFAFIVLQKMGLVNLVNAGTVSYGTAFVIGVIASLSTCMAVVGGLVLSMSATFTKEGDAVKPQMLFHSGRIISFFVFGGVIGMIGSAFTLNANAIFILGLLIAIVMLILGLNLLDVFDWAKKLQPAMPKFLSQHALGVSRFNHTLTPLFVGVATFFLPCGFTQSMQLATLTTGTFLKGGFTMLSFALGTLPVLALISFSSFSIRNSSKAGVFFKTSGLIVILFAVFNLINSFAAVGIIPPLFNF